MTTLIFSEKSFPAAMAAEMLRSINPEEVTLRYTDTVTDTERFFLEEQYNTYDRIYLIGDVIDDFTRDYVSGLEVPNELIGLTDVKIEAEGYSWMVYCDPTPAYACSYFQYVLKIVAPEVAAKFKPVLLALQGKTMLGYRVFSAMFCSMDFSDFTQWLRERYEAVLAGEKLFDPLSLIVVDRIKKYQACIDSQFLQSAVSDGDTAVGFTMTGDADELERYLEHFKGESVIKVFAIADCKLFVFTRCSKEQSKFSARNRFYSIGVKEVDLLNVD